ncbi:MAG: hypothetical protein ACRDJ3_09890, partial [Solirubrobacteraceae bacterium]
MDRFLKSMMAIVLAVVTLCAPVSAVAAEATLTEVVEAVNAERVQVEALKGENHTDLSALATLFKAPVAVSWTGEPVVKVASPLEVTCASGCSG